VDSIEDLGDYDAIVVGAGMAGLTAANTLVERGRSVLLLEKHAVVGGCTMNFERQGYRFEASTHVINGCGPGGMTYRALEKIGAQDRIEFLRQASFGRMVDEEQGLEFDLPWALAGHVEMLVRRFPGQEAGIRSFYAKYGPMAETLLETVGADLAADPDLVARLGPAAATYADLAGRKAIDVIGEHVSDPGLVEAMLAIASGFMGTAHDRIDAASGLMCDLVFRAHGGDAWYPRGGSGHMSQVLADLFVERGGTLLLNRGVREIVFDEGRVTGVVAKRRAGRGYAARARTVVVASDLTALVERLCPAGSFPPDYVHAVRERKPSISSVILFVGLDLDLRARGVHECKVSRRWAGGRARSPFGAVAREARYDDLASGMATIYSNIDPSCCPPGKSVIATMGLAEPDLFEAALGRGRQRGRAYRELKQRISEQLLDKMQRALDLPDLRDHIEVLELATPVTIQRYTENRAGAYVGWRYSPVEAQSHFDQQSPVTNLFLCGHWVAPGGGVSNAITGGVRAGELADAWLSRI